MKQSKTYEATDKLIDLIRDNYNVLQSPLGFRHRIGIWRQDSKRGVSSSAKNSHQLSSALFSIYNNEEWLANHQNVEDKILVPLIYRMEQDLKIERINSAISAFANAENSEQSESISEREREVIVAIVQGMSNKQIADHLCISPHTVITHRKNIARKLQIHSPAGLTVYAIANGLVEIGKTFSS